MSPFSEMRDPRESQLLGIEGVVGWIADETTIREELAHFADLDRRARSVKDRVKVLALTRDDLSDRDDAVFGRGFAHPRLWEHYAEEHRGVCLVLDRAALIESATHDLRRKGDLTHRKVKYVDSELAREAREVIMNDVRDQPASQALDEHLKKYAPEIFFTKLKDWASEMEYRLVLATANVEPAYVGIRGALRAIILGEQASDVYLPSLIESCREERVEIYKIRWPYGRPRLEARSRSTRPT
jgi:Protein of unknown function (DUF2971)